MDVIYTTLAQIREHSPCPDRWKLLNTNLGSDYGDDTPLTFKQIFESNVYEDMFWCLRAVDEKYYPLWRHLAVDYVEDAKHLVTDERFLKALEVARLHADGLATDEELAAARDATSDATSDASSAAIRAAVGGDWAAWDATRDATRAAGACAGACARAAAWFAARAAASAARVARATRVAMDAGVAIDASSASRDAAWDAWAALATARDSQVERLFKYCETGERVL